MESFLVDLISLVLTGYLLARESQSKRTDFLFHQNGWGFLVAMKGINTPTQEYLDLPTYSQRQQPPGTALGPHTPTNGTTMG